MIDINPPVIKDFPDDLRTCIREDFTDGPGDLPIGGGWGYSPEDAIVLDLGESKEPMAREALQIEVIRYRVDYELIHLRPPGHKYEGIKWTILDRKSHKIDGKNYECLRCTVTAHTAEDWDALRHAYSKGLKDPNFNKEEHMEMHEELMRRYVGEFWFEA